jgi:hypothetical protein
MIRHCFHIICTATLLFLRGSPLGKARRPIAGTIGKRRNEADARKNATRRDGRLCEMALSKGLPVATAMCCAFLLAISKNRLVVVIQII